MTVGEALEIAKKHDTLAGELSRIRGPFAEERQAMMALAAEVRRLQAGWISVEERLPAHGQYVLVDPPYCSGAFPDEPRHVLQWNSRLKRFQYYALDAVFEAHGEVPTRWQPLPKPSNGE